MAEPILTLSTLAPERPVIDIDGTFYSTQTREDMGLEDLVTLDAIMQRYYDLMFRVNAGAKLQRSDAADLSTALKEVVNLVVLAPPEILDKLHDSHRLATCLAFSAALQNKTPPTATQENRAARRRTGANSSRRSNGSTAATPATG